MKGVLDVEFRYAALKSVCCAVKENCHVIEILGGNGQAVKLQTRKLFSDDRGEQSWTEWQDIPTVDLVDLPEGVM